MVIEEMVSLFLASRRLGLRESGAKVKASPKTLEHYEYNLNKFLRLINQDLGIEPIVNWQSLKRTHIHQIIAYVDERVASGVWSEATKICFWKVVRVFFRWAAKDPDCVEAGLKPMHQHLPIIGRTPARIYVPEKKQLREFRNAHNTRTMVGFRDYVVMSLLLDTGMRAGELSNIRTENLILGERVIMTKGKTGNRLIPFSTASARLLEKWLRKRVAFKKTCQSPYLFVSSKHEKLTVDAIGKGFRRRRATGQRISPHTMRHTFSTMFLQNGGDMETLRQITGHSSYEMLMNYLHITDIGKIKDELDKRTPLTQI